MEGLHQIPAIAGDHSHHHLFHRDPGLFEAWGQGLQPVGFMDQIIHQDHRPVKGPDGLDLALQRRIVRECLDGIGIQLRLVDLIGVESLGYRIGHYLAP